MSGKPGRDCWPAPGQLTWKVIVSSYSDHRTFMEDWEVAVQAAQARRALDTMVLDIGQVSTFTEQFVICHGTNSRQVQAIADAVARGLRGHGRRPLRIEGYRNAEWILLDYGDFVVHVFLRDKRYYYDLERLWKAAPRLPAPVLA